MRLAALLLFPLMSLAADLRIDHVTVAGQSLQAMQTRLEIIGIKIEYGGAHTNHATEMAIASFPDGSYIELIARQKDFDPAALAQHPWAKFIEGDAGPCAWAVRPKDFAAGVTRLRERGLKPEVHPGGRARPDGIALQWETASLDDALFPFLIRDLTPRDKRAYPAGKPSNRDSSGVLRVVVAVNKIEDAFDRFHAAYPDAGKPLKQIDAQFGAQLAWIPDSPVIFAMPIGSASWVAQRIDKFGEGPCAFILSSKKTIKSGSKLESRWFGRDIQWFDRDQLGWRLGVEQN